LLQEILKNQLYGMVEAAKDYQHPY